MREGIKEEAIDLPETTAVQPHESGREGQVPPYAPNTEIPRRIGEWFLLLMLLMLKLMAIPCDLNILESIPTSRKMVLLNEIKLQKMHKL